MKEIVAQLLEGMTPAEREEAAACLRAMVARDRAEAAGGREVDSCPRCGCPAFVRRGRDARGRQRYLCSGCGRSFTAATLGAVSWSKLEPWQWEELAACMADGVPLRAVAERCPVSVPTAWCMRMRACQAMSARLGAFRCGEGIAARVDGTMLPESLSGGGGFEMPRPPRRHGGEAERGVSNERVCVLAGENSLGDVFAEVCCRGRATKARVREMLEGRAGDGTVLVTDAHWAYKGLEEALGVDAEHLAHHSGEEANAALTGVNALHRRPKGFLAPMNGVSTRRLPMHLAWFCWLERARRRGGDSRGLAREAVASGRYRVTRRALFREPRYNMGYWEREGLRREAISKVV